MHKQHSFSLIELMAVLAMLAVLLGMLLPAMQRARGEALQRHCQGNLRQLGIAFQLYSEDNLQRLPPRIYSECVYDDGATNWARYTFSYHGNVKLLDCPVSPDEAPAATKEGLHLYDGNYGWNFSGTQGALGPFLERLHYPSECYLLFDSGDPCVIDGGACWGNLMEELDLDFDSGLEGANRHRDQVNILFADMHGGKRTLFPFLAMPNSRNSIPWMINWQLKIQTLGKILFPDR